jgi:hypothetical protein
MPGLRPVHRASGGGPTTAPSGSSGPADGVATPAASSFRGQHLSRAVQLVR